MVASGHLKPKWLEASIQCFSQSPYKDLYLPRAFLIILNYPLLSELEYSEILVIIAYKLTSSPQAYPSLSLLMDLLGKDQIQHLNWIIQQAISIKILQNLEKRTLEVIQFLLRLLECVYNSNERKNRINFTEFYNDAVNKEISLKVDFKNWYREKYLKDSADLLLPFIRGFWIQIRNLSF